MSKATDAGGRVGSSDDVLMTRSHKDILSQNRDSLVENMNPDDVLNRLQSRKILNARDVTRVKEKGSIDTQNEGLLDILLRKPDRAFEEFLGALRETDQEHVANIIQPRSTPRSASQPPVTGSGSLRRHPPPQLDLSDDDDEERAVGGESNPVQTSTPHSHRRGAIEVGLSASNIEVAGDLDGSDATRPRSAMRSRPRSRANRSVLGATHSTRAERLKAELNEEILETSLLELQNLRDVVESGITPQSMGARSKIMDTLSQLQKFRREILDAYEGSVIFLVLCHTSEGLEDLWILYKSGQLQKLFTKTFVTSSMKQKFCVQSFSIDVRIKKEDYIRCREELKADEKMSRTSTAMKENICVHKALSDRDRSPALSPKSSPTPTRRPFSQPCRPWPCLSAPDNSQSSSGVSSSSFTSVEGSPPWFTSDDEDMTS